MNNQVSVSGGGDTTAGNDQGADVTTIGAGAAATSVPALTTLGELLAILGLLALGLGRTGRIRPCLLQPPRNAICDWTCSGAWRSG